MAILSLPLIQVALGRLSVTAECMGPTLINRLRNLSRNSVVKFTDCLNMTLIVLTGP